MKDIVTPDKLINHFTFILITICFQIHFYLHFCLQYQSTFYLLLFNFTTYLLLDGNNTHSIMRLNCQTDLNSQIDVLVE